MILRIIAKSILLPPFAQILGLVIAVILWRRYRRLAMIIGVTSGLSLALLSTPLVARNLMALLEYRYVPVDVTQLAGRQDTAIVILGAGRISAAPDFAGRDTVSEGALVRARYGAYLYRQASLPILIAGGAVLDEAESEAEIMREVLENEFNVPVTWVEPTSKTTYENATLSAELLRRAEINTILLVTHAYHLPRSVVLFEELGFTVIPAPTGFESSGHPDVWQLLIPTSRALDMSNRAIHEWLGLIVYRLLY